MASISKISFVGGSKSTLVNIVVGGERAAKPDERHNQGITCCLNIVRISSGNLRVKSSPLQFP